MITANLQKLTREEAETLYKLGLGIPVLRTAFAAKDDCEFFVVKAADGGVVVASERKRSAPKAGARVPVDCMLLLTARKPAFATSNSITERAYDEFRKLVGGNLKQAYEKRAYVEHLRTALMINEGAAASTVSRLIVKYKLIRWEPIQHSAL